MVCREIIEYRAMPSMAPWRKKPEARHRLYARENREKHDDGHSGKLVSADNEDKTGDSGLTVIDLRFRGSASPAHRREGDRLRRRGSGV